MRKIRVAAGIFWVEFPEANLAVLCGCPADSVKHLMKMGLITTEERDGVRFETGPNAILLSDIPMQKERFANLAEFPVLQMLYRQGMILPNHPNNKGIKPLLIGIENEVQAQAEYIYRGNYGLTSLEEIVETGISIEQAREMMRIKLKFAFNRIRLTEELLETRIVGREPTELRNGVFIQRQGLNQYEFIYQGEHIPVDLNLALEEEYEIPYYLGYHHFNREYFSVIHTGEGDGWDVNRPCMASIITFQGKIYLVDAGPNLLSSLQALGIGVSEIEGVFQTHAHDDHFNGLTSLIRSDHRIKYYSTPLVRASVMKKLAALTGMDESLFAKYFEIHDLQADTWNNIEGLEIKPVYSPHPVETCVIFFRTLWDDGYEAYAHLADIASLEVLRGMITDDQAQSGITQDYYDRIKTVYLTPFKLKKIDIGGGLIHGNADDFTDDTSGKILLSHTATPLSDLQKSIGDTASFGAVDVLIAADRDYAKPLAFQHLRSFFPGVPAYELEMILNCPLVSYNPGTILLRKGNKSSYVFCIVNGLLEYIAPESGIKRQMVAGSMIGELSCLKDVTVDGTYRAVTYVKALRIPSRLYIEFLCRNNLLEYTRNEIGKRSLLEKTWLFGERISCPIKSRITQAMQLETYDQGELLPESAIGGIFLLYDGEIAIYAGNQEVECMQIGDFVGEERLFNKGDLMFTARAKVPCQVYRIPIDLIDSIPIAQWKLLEVFTRRALANLDLEN
ncbi:MAG: cyclic nucleotide-binding protein [Firmicutes bacterium HGW-Firmicutes-15]|nr:MAG: cyclic nucleotide-binding protein [Firmicutes bacterium HGW-Firmicutes-15]